MIPYVAPVQDMRYAIDTMVGLDRLASLPGLDEMVSADLVDAVLTQAGQLAGDVIAPLNRIGDRQGSVLENGIVRTPDGFKDAYAQYRDGGWNAVPFDPQWGGHGMPWSVAFAIQEMWQSSNMSFGLCPLLTQGAIDAIAAHATDELKQLYLPKMVSGEWTGTMNLTEPQAGSDVGAVRTKAWPENGQWRIKGQKIYITYGEHDLSDNIVHLVLARTPGAPDGIKGISLFLVPKLLPDVAGNPGQRNDLRCVSIEHKLGINASPTCVMAYGDNDGAIGWLVGEENQGIQCMFTMMNNARLSVGLQGVAIAERAYQQARDYARTRVQSRSVASPKDPPGPILSHPDVRRMLMTMRAKIEAARGLTYYAAASMDFAHRHPEPDVRARSRAMVDVLTPVVKAWSTDLGVEVASIGIQVHGGMGFIEETGAAQHLRDARIAPIYEGTNGIQANDLVFRKILRDEGKAVAVMIDEMLAVDARLGNSDDAVLGAIRRELAAGIDALETATGWLLDTGPRNAAAVAAASVPYLELFGVVAGGWVMARQALEATERLGDEDADQDFLSTKRITARFYADHILSRAATIAGALQKAPETVMALPEEAF